jgi:hypothetical protein
MRVEEKILTEAQIEAQNLHIEAQIEVQKSQPEPQPESQPGGEHDTQCEQLCFTSGGGGLANQDGTDRTCKTHTVLCQCLTQSLL